MNLSKVPKLDSRNYTLWSFEAKNALVLNGHYKAVFGEGATDEQDMLAKAAIAAMVERMHYAFIKNKATAREVWEGLAAQFAPAVGARMVQLRRDLQSIRKGQEGMPEYLSRARDIVDELSMGGDTVSPGSVVKAVLVGLPKYYDGMMMQLLREVSKVPEDEVDMEEVFNELCMFEERMEFHEPKDTVEVYAVSHSDKKCFNCGEFGHIAKNCKKPKKGGDRRSKQLALVM